MYSHAHEIVKGLWLGDYHSSLDENFIRKNKIEAVINCAPGIKTPFKHIEYVKLNINDSLKKSDIEKMKKILPYAVSFIHSRRDIQGKNILVHCHAGMQRSAIIVLAYIAHYYGLTINQSLNYILSKRKVAFHHGKHVNFSDALLHYTK